MSKRGRATRMVFLFSAWAATLVLWGCAKAPPRPPVAPLPAPWPEPTPQEAILKQALGKFYGAPYRLGGTTPAGVDCSGLVMAVFQTAGLSLPRTAADQFTAGQPVSLNSLRFGDVVFFNRYCQVKKSGPYMAGMLPPAYISEVCHNGIYLGNGRFVHASPRGVEISQLNAEVWRNSFLGARRFFTGAGPPSP